MRKQKKLKVFTDGACSMNKTWTGGWAYLILRDYIKDDCGILKGGKEYNSTNNRMEVCAILRALKAIKRSEKKNNIKYQVEVISDSGYAVFPFLKYGWVDKWKNDNFKDDIPNYDLWSKLIPLVIYFNKRVRFTHIRGHGKNESEFHNYYNGVVDKHCVNMRLKADNLI
jgi:ribonuclease HI